MKHSKEKFNGQGNHKKRIFLLVLLLLVTGVVLSTGTYAWFFSNQTVSVNDIQVQVTTSNGIQISADGTVWKSILTEAELTSATTLANYPARVNQIPSVLQPVSTNAAPSLTGKLNMFLGTVLTNTGGDYILTSAVSGERDISTVTEGNSGGDFVTFDMFLKVTDSTRILLNTNSGVTSVDTNDLGIKNASRLAFVVLGNTESGDTLSNIQGLNDGNGSEVLVWEPNYDTHTADGVNNANDIYGITVSATAANNLTAVAYDGVSTTIDEADNVLLGEANATDNSAMFATVTPDFTTKASWTGSASANNLEFLVLSPGVTKVRVYMWVEGQDVDCENKASGGEINYNIKFTVDDTYVAPEPPVVEPEP